MEANPPVPQIPTDPRKTIVAGLLVILFAFGGFTVWASYAPLSRAVVSSGVLKVDSSRKKIQHAEGGVVEEIFVRDGDKVKRGDVLVRLDKTKAGASLSILIDSFDAANAQYARLIAERDNLDEIVFPEELLHRSQQNGGKNKASEILKTESMLFQARRSSLLGQIAIFKKQVVSINRDIAGLEAQKASKLKQRSFVTDELNSLKSLRKEGLIGKTRVLELEREAARLQGEYGEHQSDIASKETAIGEKELEIYQLDKNFKEEVVKELKAVQEELYDLQERKNAADYVMEQIEIRSPVDGTVVNSNLHTIGGVIAPGSILLEIVPENDKLIIEAKIDPKDIDDLHIGLPAGVKITAFNQRRTPELNGKLSYLSADSLVDEKSGMNFFYAKITLSEDEVSRLGDEKLQPGMMADVFIRTGQRTPAEYLMRPMRDSFRRAWLEE